MVMNDAIVELATELRALREKSHRSLRDLQEATFASDSSLSRYLSGRTVPPWQVVEALCRLAGREPAELRPTWERARHARGKNARRPRSANVVSAPATVTTRDISIRDAEAGSRGHNVLALLAAAAAVGLAAVLIWRWRLPAG